MEIKNAKITSTMLGYDSHEILTCYLYLDYGGAGQGFGGYGFPDKFNPEFKRLSYGTEFISRILKVVGVEQWEHLPGKYIRVKAEHEKVHEIGNILNDEWFNPVEDLRIEAA